MHVYLIPKRILTPKKLNSQVPTFGTDRDPVLKSLKLEC